MAYLGAIGKRHTPDYATFGGVITGTVHDAAGNPVERTILAINKATHYVTGTRSRASDGHYTLYTCHQLGQVQHLVVEVSSDPTYDSRIHDQVYPDSNGI